MLTWQTAIEVDGICGEELFDFLADPSDRAYQQWWPDTHLHLHPVERHAGHVGDVIYMDEYIGKRRVRMTGIVLQAVPGRRLVWQLRKLIRLPVRLELELANTGSGVRISHTTRAGFGGAGRILDPLFRLLFSSRLAEAMDAHVRTEFSLLRDRLPEIRGKARPATVAFPTT